MARRRRKASGSEVSGEVIIKVHLPLDEHGHVDRTQPAMCYDETRHVTWTEPVTDKLLAVMKGRIKTFFFFGISGPPDGAEDDLNLSHVREAPWQDW